MRTATLVRRTFGYFGRTTIAVVLGVATAVAVLAGALVVGDSVRASLRDLVLNRLGRTDTVISAANFFRESLADELARGERFTTCPLVVFEGLATHEASGRRASAGEGFGGAGRFSRLPRVPFPPRSAGGAPLGGGI